LFYLTINLSNIQHLILHILCSHSSFIRAYFTLQSIQRWLVQSEAMATVLLHVCYSVALIGLLLLCIQRSICKITHLFRLVMEVKVVDHPLTLT
jgi:hypothetical protein